MAINLTKQLGYPGDSEDFLREMRSSQGYKRYREMYLNNSIIGAMMAAIELSVNGVTWSFTSDVNPEDDERVEFLNECKEALTTSWGDFISDALTCLVYGWSYFETTYKRDGARVLWDKFGFRGQDTLEKWEYKPDGSLLGMVQRVPPSWTYVTIPLEKSIHFRARTNRDNPEGLSILRNAWVSYYFLKNIQQIEAIGVERDIAGMPKITLPEGASVDESDSTSDAYLAAKFVRNIRNDDQAGIVLPPGWEFELVSTGGSRQFDTGEIVRRYQSEILMSALAQFLMLGQQKVGSLALSKDQTDLFVMSVNAIADKIAEQFTHQEVNRVLTLNGYDPEGIRLDHSAAGDVDIQSVADFLQKTGDKLTWMPQDEVWLRGLAKLPDVTPEEIELERERKRQEAMQMIAARRPERNDDNGVQREREEREEGQEGQAQMSAEYYATDPALDERMRWERRMQRLVQAYFADQKKRLVNYGKAQASR